VIYFTWAFSYIHIHSGAGSQLKVGGTNSGAKNVYCAPHFYTGPLTVGALLMLGRYRESPSPTSTNDVYTALDAECDHGWLSAVDFNTWLHVLCRRQVLSTTEWQTDGYRLFDDVALDDSWCVVAKFFKVQISVGSEGTVVETSKRTSRGSRIWSVRYFSSLTLSPFFSLTQLPPFTSPIPCLSLPSRLSCFSLK